MDPLSVTASIVGILAAAGKISELLHTVISSAKEAPQVVTALVFEIKDVQAAFSSLQGLLADISSAPPRRAALIQVDRLIVTLTETVLTFSELEAFVAPLVVPQGQKFSIKTRLKWTRVEAGCEKLVGKLQRHKASVSLMLNILQCGSDAEAARSQESLEILVQQLLHSNQELCKRLGNLEDSFDARSTITTTRIDSRSLVSQEDNETITTTRPQNSSKRRSIREAIKIRFAFDEDLEASRVYSRAALNDCCDVSFVSSAARTTAWSVFSGLSLADISVISVVALPVYPRDVANLERYYSFGYLDTDMEAEPGEEEGGTERLGRGKGVVRIEALRDEEGNGDRMGSEDGIATSRSLSPDREGAVYLPQDESHSGPSNRDDSGHEDENEDEDEDEDGDDACPCKSCGENVKETKAFNFSGSKWHKSCFRCHTCKDQLDLDTPSNLFLSETGNLLCSGCTFDCSSCRTKLEVAILADDRAYCPACFKCRRCNLRIDNLRYVRTSRGLFCTPCHEVSAARQRHRRSKTIEVPSPSPNPRTPFAMLPLQIPRAAMSTQVVLGAPPRAGSSSHPAPTPMPSQHLATSLKELLSPASSPHMASPKPEPTPKDLEPLFCCAACGTAADDPVRFLHLLDGSCICRRAECVAGYGSAF